MTKAVPKIPMEIRLKEAEAAAKVAALRAAASHDRLAAKVNNAAYRRVLNLEKSPLAARAYAGSYRSTEFNNQRRAQSGARRPLPGTANQHLDRRSAELLRLDSQELFRNNPIARAMVGRFAECVAGGIGPRFMPATGDEKYDAAVLRFYEKWGDTPACDVRGQSKLTELVTQVLESAAVDGDALVVLSEIETQAGFVPAIQIVEGSRLREASSIRTSGGRRVVNGIEYKIFDGVEEDPNGRPVAYHLDGDPAKVIKAEQAFLYRCPLRIRPGQTRGEPMLSAVSPMLERIDAICESTAVSAQVAALVSLIIKSNDPAGMHGSLTAQAQALESDINQNELGAKNHVMTPGSVIHLGVGEDAQSFTPNQPNQQLDSFIRLMLRICSADIGLPNELIILDPTDTNYHGFKSAVSNSYRGAVARGVRSMQTLLTWVLDFTLSSAAARGLITDESGKPIVKTPPSPTRHSWIFPPPPLVDPAKDIDASLRAVEGNLCTKSDAVMELYGDNFKLVAMKRAEETKLENDLGIKPAPLPGAAPAAADPT